MMTAKFSILDVENPSYSGKRLRLENGVLSAATDGRYISATSRTMQVSTAAELHDVWAGLGPSNCLLQGVCVHSPARLRPIDHSKIEIDEDPSYPVVSRSHDHFPRPVGPGLMLVDTDQARPPSEVLSLLHDACSALARVSCVQATSTGSEIFAIPSGATLKKNSGTHTIFLAKDSSDVPRALLVLHKRLWLAGHGYIKLAETGDILVRSAVDLAMQEASQPLYIKAHLGTGLEQRKIFSLYEHSDSADFLDTRAALPDLTQQEEGKYRQLVGQAAEEIRPQALETQRKYRINRLADMQVRGADLKTAIASFNAAVAGRDLWGMWTITLSDGTQLTVDEIMTAPANYHGCGCRDPLEPNYGGNAVATIYANQEKPVIKSFAHGGQMYFLHAGEPGTHSDASQIDDIPPPKIVSADCHPSPSQNSYEAFESFRAHDWKLEEMLADVVMLQDGAVVTRISQPHICVSFSVFRTLTAGSFSLNEDGRRPRKILIADQWNTSLRRLEVWSRTSAPGRSPICVDPQGRRCVNLWRPVPDDAPEDWEEQALPFLQHIEYLVPEVVERERFMDWLAHALQSPEVRPTTHYLMRTRGTQGIGRNWLAEVLSRVLPGQVALNVDLMGLLAGGFNGSIAGSTFAIVDELHSEQSRMTSKNLAQALKSELTATVRHVNPKYGRQYEEFCVTRWLMLSNHVSAIPISKEDRRLIVIENPNVARPAAYYERLYGVLSNRSFIASVRRYLTTRNLQNFKPGEHAQMTAAKRDTVAASVTDMEMGAEEVVDSWNSDLILTADLAFQMRDAEGRPANGNAMRAAALDAGMMPRDKQIRFGGKPQRYWIVRNHDKWLTASISACTAEIRRGRGQVPDTRSLAESEPLQVWQHKAHACHAEF